VNEWIEENEEFLLSGTSHGDCQWLFLSIIATSFLEYIHCSFKYSPFPFYSPFILISESDWNIFTKFPFQQLLLLWSSKFTFWCQYSFILTKFSFALSEVYPSSCWAIQGAERQWVLLLRCTHCVLSEPSPSASAVGVGVQLWDVRVWVHVLGGERAELLPHPPREDTAHEDSLERSSHSFKESIGCEIQTHRSRTSALPMTYMTSSQSLPISKLSHPSIPIFLFNPTHMNIQICSLKTKKEPPMTPDIVYLSSS
jgi:hypothetical protein